MKISTILKTAKKMIADPAKHLGPGDAFDPGLMVPAVRGDCFCLWGAIYHQGVTREKIRQSTWKAIGFTAEVALDVWGLETIQEVNDEHGYDAAHILVDEAIKRALKAKL